MKKPTTDDTTSAETSETADTTDETMDEATTDESWTMDDAAHGR